jgi:hypothetical protein
MRGLMFLVLFATLSGSAYAHADRVERPHSQAVSFATGESAVFQVSGSDKC